MKIRRFLISGIGLMTIYGVAAAGCGGDDSASTDDAGADVTIDTAQDQSTPPQDVAADRGAELTGQSCKAPSDCYPGVDAQAVQGQVTCLDRVTNGYCTHTCTKDSDCCATAGECRTGLKQVCAPFESTGAKYCFLSCEQGDIGVAVEAGADAGATPDDYCKRQASTDFSCRSTGGGAENRKVCLPNAATDGGGGDGAIDAADTGTVDAADAADADGG
jgi:hypothetical protein